MRSESFVCEDGNNLDHKPALPDANIVIYFAAKSALEANDWHGSLKNIYPDAIIMGCSTGGEIFGREVYDDSVSVLSVKLEHTDLDYTSENISEVSDSYTTGAKISKALNKPGLSYIMILADGTNVNGSELIRGLYSDISEDVIITGGLAGDGDKFESTLVGINEAPKEKKVTAIGFYGDALNVSYGSLGGWNAFGPQRIITKSEGNILYELDDKPALDLYKKYLGDNAKNLPGDALLFPLSIRPPDEDFVHDIVRTIVGIDEEKNAMIFAGDVPEGYIAQLMHGDSQNLMQGATNAAEKAHKECKESERLAIMVSCIGRKLLLGQQVSEETEAVMDIFGDKVKAIGFYSYGEICHQQFTDKCSLHNQTMTVTMLSENE